MKALQVAMNAYSQAFRTKLEIAEAMNELCEEMPFSKLKVDTIVGKVGISRSSFYYHFTDKNAVVSWLTNQFYQAGIDEIGRTLSWFEGHLFTTCRFQQFQALLTSAEELTDYDAAIPSFVRHRSEVLLETLTQYQHIEATPLLQFQIRATADIEISMTSSYRNGEFGDMKTKEFCTYLTQCVPRELFDALDKPVMPAMSTEGMFFFG